MKSRAVFFLSAAVFWHLWTLVPAWISTTNSANGRDFASYYYAVQVAADGGNAYDTPALSKAARAEKTRKTVHPYLYAPPFLLTMVWAIPLDLHTSYKIWFWLHELAMIATMLIIARWWRSEGEEVLWVLAVLVALMTAIPNNHLMGQANFFGMALAMAGLWMTQSKRPLLGGALMGVACMLKMSPALFVIWWFVRREWVAIGVSVATAVVLSILSLPLAPVAVQTTFFTEVLPGFGSGSYNGLKVPIGLFGNHSLPNLWHQMMPSGGPTLSSTAKRLGQVTSLTLLGLGAVVWWPKPNHRQLIAQTASIGIALLLIPVYTYEHHLVWALPAMAWCVIRRERLPPIVLIAVGLSIAMLCVDLQTLKRLSLTSSAPWGWMLQETKTFALVVLLGVTAWLGATDVDGVKTVETEDG